MNFEISVIDRVTNPHVETCQKFLAEVFIDELDRSGIVHFKEKDLFFMATDIDNGEIVGVVHTTRGSNVEDQTLKKEFGLTGVPEDLLAEVAVLNLIGIKKAYRSTSVALELLISVFKFSLKTIYRATILRSEIELAEFYAQWGFNYLGHLYYSQKANGLRQNMILFIKQYDNLKNTTPMLHALAEAQGLPNPEQDIATLHHYFNCNEQPDIVSLSNYQDEDILDKISLFDNLSAVSKNIVKRYACVATLRQGEYYRPQGIGQPAISYLLTGKFRWHHQGNISTLLPGALIGLADYQNHQCSQDFALVESEQAVIVFFYHNFHEHIIDEDDLKQFQENLRNAN